MKNVTDDKSEMLLRMYTNLEQAINDRNLTRNALKEMSGVNLARYKVSNGSQGMREPSITSLIKIADALQISLDELCGRTEYIKNMNSWNAGECLDMLLRLTEFLNGEISADGCNVKLHPSNVTEVINKANEYVEWYDKGREMEPERFCEDVGVVRQRYLIQEIDRLKAKNEPITITVENDSNWTETHPDEELQF